MAAISVKGRAPVLQAPQDCEDCIGQRQSCGEQRKNQRGCGRGACAFGGHEIEAKEGDAETQRRAAGISHKNFRGREIEDQKCDAGAEHAPGQRAADRAERGAWEKNIGCGDYSGDPGSETIRAIEKIESEDARGDVAGFTRARTGS